MFSLLCMCKTFAWVCCWVCRLYLLTHCMFSVRGSDTSTVAWILLIVFFKDDIQKYLSLKKGGKVSSGKNRCWWWYSALVWHAQMYISWVFSNVCAICAKFDTWRVFFFFFFLATSNDTQTEFFKWFVLQMTRLKWVDDVISPSKEKVKMWECVML